MDGVVAKRRSETDAHLRLKRLALLWAQANGYSACATEVSLPRSRYRADVAAYRTTPKPPGVTAIFECKQATADLRRDNCSSAATRERLCSVSRRRDLLEKRLRIHYPTLRTGESLFAEYDTHDFSGIGHQTYRRIVRELTALQSRLNNAVKFESLVRYRCANLFFLVLPGELFRDSDVPPGWGVLVETNGSLDLARRPIWHDKLSESSLSFLQRIAVAGTRQFNKHLGITFDEIRTTRQSSRQFV